MMINDDLVYLKRGKGFILLLERLLLPQSQKGLLLFFFCLHVSVETPLDNLINIVIQCQLITKNSNRDERLVKK